MTRIAFSNLAAPDWALERTVEAVHELGYDGLELRLLDGEPIDVLALASSTRRAVGATLADVSLACLDTSVELAGAFERTLPAAVELAREWGTDTVRVFGGDVADLEDVARRLEPLLEPDVTVALETHDHFASAARVAELLGLVGSPSLAAIWDLHHPARLGESPAEVMRALGPAVRLVHVKDARRRGNDWDLVPLGDGDVPVRASLDVLRAHGYDGWLTVEWEKRWHPELAEPELALPDELQALRALLG
ncbi:MAG TPA: sugar phosphate isomerase/epimerase family protein [Gaiellaceae bacterium]|jgi:fatty-acyl-CoA synthase